MEKPKRKKKTNQGGSGRFQKGNPGRPPTLKIQPEQVRTFAFSGATNVEIAEYFGCEETTIRRRFAVMVRQGRAERKIMLRNEQNKVAREGNPTMLIWLGKNELGQSDKQTIEHTGADGGPIKSEQTVKFDHEKFAELYRLRTRGNQAQPGSAKANGNG